MFKGHEASKLSRKNIYNLLLKEDKCHCEKMWENKNGESLNEMTWKNIFLCTKETKLQEIQ